MQKSLYKQGLRKQEKMNLDELFSATLHKHNTLNFPANLYMKFIFLHVIRKKTVSSLTPEKHKDEACVRL